MQSLQQKMGSAVIGNAFCYVINADAISCAIRAIVISCTSNANVLKVHCVIPTKEMN